MLGLFGTLNLGTRSLSTQQLGTEVAGHNLANVNNPAYARQRLAIQTALPVPSELGPQGTGAEGAAIVQLRNNLLDRQILSEVSVGGALTAEQQALQYAQANLGQQIDRQTSGAEGAAAAGGVGGQHGLAEGLADLFNAFQGLSTNPTSLAERQVLLIKAQNLGLQFNQTAQRLANVNAGLNDSVRHTVDQANLALGDIAKLNEQVLSAEMGGSGIANDLRDIRQQKIEDLAKFTHFTAVTQASGSIDIVVGGVSMVSGSTVLDRLEAYDPGSGQLGVRAQSTGTPLTVTGGSLAGTISVRDTALAQLRSDVAGLASRLITEVNTLHRAGFSLSGSTGADFFTGTDAATLGVNAVLSGNPSLVQAAGVAGAAGDNQVALALSQLGNRPIAALNNQTLGQRFGQIVAGLGQSLASANAQIDNQDLVQKMLLRQRDSVSGVSLDEEMSDLLRFQRAYQASARLITTIDEMLEIAVNLKR